MTFWKTSLVLALLVTALFEIGGKSGFCLSQGASFPISSNLQNPNSFRSAILYQELKSSVRHVRTSSIDSWIGASEAFSRAA